MPLAIEERAAERMTTAAQDITVEEALKELREMFPMSLSSDWHDFEICARVYFGEWEPFLIVHFAVDGCGRRWRDYSWEGKTITDCMAQVRQWGESR